MFRSIVRRWSKDSPRLVRVMVAATLLLIVFVPTVFAEMGYPAFPTPVSTSTAVFPTESVTPPDMTPTSGSATATPVETEWTPAPSETVTPVETEWTPAPSETATPVETEWTPVPSTTPSPTPTGEQCEGVKNKLVREIVLDKVSDIQKLIDAGKYQEAIDLAVKEYGIDVSAVSGKPTYDGAVAGDGETCKDGKAGKVKIGKAGFKSPGWLASTIGHEAGHARQARDGRWYTDAQGSAMNEVECYDWEIANAAANGLSAAEKDELNKRRKSYYDKLTDANKKRVDGGTYTLP